MDLQSILGSMLSNSNTTKAISEKTGLDEDQVSQAISVGLPVILGGMAKNAQTSEGAASLDSALAQHIDSPVVDDPTKAASDEVAKDGNSILGHVFGTGTDSVSGTIAKKIGADPKKVQSALAILAPIAIGYLAKHKNEKKLDADGVATTLNKTQSAAGNPITDVLTSVLGSVLGSKK